MINVQDIPTGRLVQEYRTLLLSCDPRSLDIDKMRQAEVYEAEVLRRMAW